jgi:hypothetical protein
MTMAYSQSLGSTSLSHRLLRHKLSCHFKVKKNIHIIPVASGVVLKGRTNRKRGHGGIESQDSDVALIAKSRGQPPDVCGGFSLVT